MSRPSTAVAVWWASGLRISSSASLSRLLYLWGRFFQTLA
uniref:Uncharacterized protein n=1 Tax=Fagus sylvatica TaxID=28930 RepID=A0A2N9FVX9_FAGSY